MQRDEKQEKTAVDQRQTTVPAKSKDALRAPGREPRQEPRAAVEKKQDVENKERPRLPNQQQHQQRSKQRLQVNQKATPRKKLDMLAHQLKHEETAEDIRLDNMVIEKEIELVIAEIKAISIGYD